MSTLLWVAVVLMLAGAAFLIADVGAPAIWISVITVGIAVVVLDSRRGGSPLHR